MNAVNQDVITFGQEVLGQQECNFYFAPDESRYFYASTSVGSGKTLAAINYLLSADAASKNHMYVAPTIKLVNQTCKAIRDNLSQRNRSTRNLNLVHSESLGEYESATESALKVINESVPNTGVIVILTTKTFLTILPLIRNKAGWGVTLDEAFSPLQFIEYKLGQENREAGRQYFESLFEVDESNCDLVRPASDKYNLVKRVAAGDWTYAGTKYRSMQELAQCVTNGALQVELAARHEDKYLFATWVTPGLFGEFIEVIFLAAMFEQSVLYKLWKTMYRLDFRSHRYFEREIVRDVHKSQGPLVAIGHVLHKDDHASRYVLQKNARTGDNSETVRGERVVDRAVSIASKYFTGTPFLLQVNSWTGYHSNYKEAVPPDAELIPTVAHGLNSYQGYKAIAAFAVTNPTPSQKTWIQKRTGLSDQEIYMAFRIHTVYQACGRTAVRNADNQEQVIFLTLGEEDARFLSRLFQGSRWLGQVGDMPKYLARGAAVTDLPEYQELRKVYMRLSAKKGRGTATEDTFRELNEIRTRIEEMRNSKTNTPY